MKINEKKSKVMIFNTRINYDGRPRLAVGKNEYLEVIESHKLLGVIVRSDLRWVENTDYICRKGYSRLWLIRRLRILGANKSEMLDIYFKQVRSLLEMAVPVWQAGLTKEESYQIERVQRTALHIILGKSDKDYENALEQLKCERLSIRRVQLCESFAKKAVKQSQFKNWFCENTENPSISTRSKNKRAKYHEVLTRTDRYKKSPIPYLTTLLNTLAED